MPVCDPRLKPVHMLSLLSLGMDTTFAPSKCYDKRPRSIYANPAGVRSKETQSATRCPSTSTVVLFKNRPLALITACPIGGDKKKNKTDGTPTPEDGSGTVWQPCRRQSNVSQYIRPNVEGANIKYRHSRSTNPGSTTKSGSLID